jgi:hypothetical protein
MVSFSGTAIPAGNLVAFTASILYCHSLSLFPFPLYVFHPILVPTALAEPPICVFDCDMFKFVTTGVVDDCAVLQSWIGDACLNDCGGAEVQEVEHLKDVFCSSSSGGSSYGGSYGNGYGLWDATQFPTSNPTPGSSLFAFILLWW